MTPSLSPTLRREICLSRPAILKRFRSTHALKLRVTRFQVDLFIQRLRSLPARRSGDSLLELVDLMGQMTRTRAGVGRFFARQKNNPADTELATIERRRGKAWLAAIDARMHKTHLPREGAVRSFAALLAGAVMQWRNQPGANGASYLRACAED